MAGLSMYLDEPDVRLLLSWLNEDEEVAFLILAERKIRPTRKLKRLRESGQDFTFYNIGGLSPLVHIENRWIAVKRLDALHDGDYTLWHIPTGPLPLLSGDGQALTFEQALGHEDGAIENPWAGWVERRPGANPSQPYFGPGHPGIIDLEVQTRELQHLEMEEDFVTVRRRVCDEQVIGLSSFGWIGNHYRNLGDSARPATERWWRRLRRRVRAVAKPITMVGPMDGAGADVYAFPAALATIQGGMRRSYR